MNDHAPTPAGAVMADVTSANIVGYAGSTLNNYAGKGVAAQFCAVGNNAKQIPLSSIKALGDDAIGNVELQVLDPGGKTQSDQDYLWIGEDDGGWGDFEGNPLENEVLLDAGQGLWALTMTEGATIQTSGQVIEEDIVVTLNDYAGIGTGNPYPVSIKLSEIMVYGDDAIGNVELQILDPGGKTQADQDYLWIGEDDGGWGDFEGNPLEKEVEIPAGQGVWVLTMTEGASIRFSAPEL